ncbi:uncharacterized protein TM35_000251020 [Trypanosoma theileri]|uniref:Uncharacterized protein n=1 Tax=Trypanosoma theileri TaxID=67003 RepID=A0A1X0NQ14_9TRYP|nr:uncharacterized protein TM35_000251020 [Trypanosoma theileri]ORC86806.1 hypothetical protein TM35_000251020 [Trypanosoma theileri]
MKYNMSHSLFVVLLILLLGCISGYAQGSRSEESIIRTIGGDSKEVYQTKESTDAMKLEEDVSYRNQKIQPFLETDRNPFHPFHGSHLLWLGNKKLVTVATSRLLQLFADKTEFIDFFVGESSNNGEKWEDIKKKRFSFFSYSYNASLWNPKDYGTSHDTFVLVESKALPSKYDSKSTQTKIQNSTLRFVGMSIANNGSGKFMLSHTPLNVAFPFYNGNEMVVRFLADEITPILRMTNYGFVFPVQFLTADDKFRSSVMVDNFEHGDWNVGGLTDEGTYNPAVLEWENNLMMVAQHTSGHYRVYESTDLGDTWTESTSTLSRVWATSTKTTEHVSQNNFITATIDGKDVILFLQSVGSGEENKLHLWVTDNTRIYHVGLIVEKKKVKRSTLLFKGDKLYCLYETVEGAGKYKVFFVDLTTSMEEIKRVLNKWSKQDALLSGKVCPSSRQLKNPVPTVGLVGYLSENRTESKWNDEYLGVNAVVSGTTEKVSNGLKFNGVDAGARWPVSINELAKQYHFTNYAFTLVATVTIHEVPKKESSPLLGVRLDNNEKGLLFGVSYNKDQTWSTIRKDEAEKSTIKFELQKAYSVILTFKDGKGIVYINGKRINKLYYAEIQNSKEVSHFYFGWDGKNNDERSRTIPKPKTSIAGEEIVHITVKDVLLYNRALDTEEIDVLVKNKENGNAL